MEKEKATEPKAVKVKATEAEVVYSVQEFEATAKTLFGCQSECVKAAFLMAQKTNATESEAKKIVSDFMKKEA